jgi:hypothetical protein
MTIEVEMGIGVRRDFADKPIDEFRRLINFEK